MAWRRVESYSTYLNEDGTANINLYSEGKHVGRINAPDMLHMHAVIDMLRNEGPYVEFEDYYKRLWVGAEPVAEGE